MTIILLLLSLAASLCASSQIADKIYAATNADAVLKIWHSDARTPEQQGIYFKTIFGAWPWDTLSSEQQRTLISYWRTMKPETQVEVSSWLPAEVLAQLEETTAPSKHQHHHHHHHKPTPAKKPTSKVTQVYYRVDPRKNVSGVDAGSSEFQLSTQSQQTITDKVGYPKTIGLLDGFPAVGVYGTPYLFRTRLALIEFGPNALKAVPTAVAQQVNTKQADIHVVVSGLLQGDKTDRVNNLVYHAWVAKLEGKDRFNAGVPMGIFMANGVKAAPSESVAVNSLGASSVNPHDPIDLSPNNARFEIIEGRNVATFWSVAQYKNAATVTFHIILNDPKLVDIFQVCVAHAETSVEFVECLKSLKGSDAAAIVAQLFAA